MDREKFEYLCMMHRMLKEARHPIALLVEELIDGIVRSDGKRLLTEMFKLRANIQN